MSQKTGLAQTVIEDIRALRTYLQRILASPDTIIIMDELAASATKDYSTRLMRKGKITKIWLQFYWTTALLSYFITLDGSQILRNVTGSGNLIALHNTIAEFVVTIPFDVGANLNFHCVNSDSVDLHRVRAIVSLEYDAI